jgi:hypothetical protein
VLLEHITEHRDTGSPLSDLLAVLPDLTRNQVQMFLKQLREEGKAHPVGATKAARWFPGPDPGIAGESP